MNEAYIKARYICNNASNHNQRTGQFLFNSLPPTMATRVRSSAIDPFHKDLSFDEVVKWYDDHIIFNEEGDMIGLFAGNVVLWEEHEQRR